MIGDEVKGAVMGEAGKYRYLLTRQWDPSKDSVMFLMLNPSTADDALDDSTTRACREIAKYNGFGGMVFTNLYALRSKNPEMLFGRDDATGPENDHYIKWAASKVSMIVLAWGNLGPTVEAGRVEHVLDMLRNYWGQVCVIDLTVTNQPRHPRFVPAHTQLRRLDVAAWRRGDYDDALIEFNT